MRRREPAQPHDRLVDLLARVHQRSRAHPDGGARGPFGGILTESLIIAGWVVMWHPLEVLLYGLWPVVRERKLLDEGLPPPKLYSDS